MFRPFPLALAASFVLLPSIAGQGASASEHDHLVAKHAAAYGVPEALVRRVIHIESKGNPRVVSKGNYGLMQIRLGTAKAMGYTGDAEGLLDADTNMTYAVRYLAGAYRAAGGNSEQAIRNYQRGYYDRAKAQGFSPYSPIAATQQAAAPDPAMVKEAEQRRQQADRQRVAAEQQRLAALQSRIEQQKSAEAARAAQRQAALQEKAERKNAIEQQRVAQRQAALQQQVDRDQARQQQRIDREQPKEPRQVEQPSAQAEPAVAPVAARPVRRAAAPAQAWYNPMRYFNHPAHKAHPYKPQER